MLPGFTLKTHLPFTGRRPAGSSITVHVPLDMIEEYSFCMLLRQMG